MYPRPRLSHFHPSHILDHLSPVEFQGLPLPPSCPKAMCSYHSLSPPLIHFPGSHWMTDPFGSYFRLPFLLHHLPSESLQPHPSNSQPLGLTHVFSSSLISRVMWGRAPRGRLPLWLPSLEKVVLLGEDTRCRGCWGRDLLHFRVKDMIPRSPSSSSASSMPIV